MFGMMKRNVVFLVLCGALISSCSDNEKVQVKEPGYCATSQDCGENEGCLLAQNKCYPLTSSKACNNEEDCPEGLACFSTTTESGKDKAGYCSIACTSNEDCLSHGRAVLCSKNVDINKGMQYCTKIPGTCGNGQLDEGENCDVTEDGKTLFAKENVTCHDWDPTKSYKMGGKPGCSSDCLSYSKGRGATKCAESSAPSDVNGFDSCIANLYIDDTTEVAYATVNYYTTNPNKSTEVQVAIACQTPEQTIAIALTPQNLPESIIKQATSSMCHEQNGRKSCTIELERELKTEGLGAEELVCVVYLSLPGDNGKDSDRKGVMCQLVYNDNVDANGNRVEDPHVLHLPSDALRDPKACVTLPKQCSEAEKLKFEELKTEEEKQQYRCEINDDYLINDLYRRHDYCRISDYPYVSLKRPYNVIDIPKGTLAYWDKFDVLGNGTGGSLNNSQVIPLLTAGLQPEEGICAAEDSVCNDLRLSLGLQNDASGKQIKLAKNNAADSSKISGMPLESLQLGAFDEEFDISDPLKTSYLKLESENLNKFNNLKLTLTGITFTTKRPDEGRLAIGYSKGGVVIVPENYTNIAFPTQELCTPIEDPDNPENKSVDVTKPFACKHPDSGEATVTYTISEEPGVDAIYIFMYQQPGGNFKINTIILSNDDDEGGVG